MATTFYIVRHGTTVWNVEKRYQGWADIPLDDFGHRQGALLSDYFQDISIDVGVSSPLQRATKTLDYILNGKEVPVQIEKGLMEIDQGKADGLTYEELVKVYPDYAYTTWNTPGVAQAPQGENSGQVQKRMVQTIEQLAAAYPGKTLAMVSHGFAISMLLNYIKGIPLEKAEFMIPDNVSVSKIEVDEQGNMKIDYYNDSSHIPEELVFNYSHG